METTQAGKLTTNDQPPPTTESEETETSRTPPPSLFDSEPIMMVESALTRPDTESVVTRHTTLDTLRNLQNTAPGIFKQNSSASVGQPKSFGDRIIDNVSRLKEKIGKRNRQEPPEAGPLLNHQEFHAAVIRAAADGLAAGRADQASGLASGNDRRTLPWMESDHSSSDEQSAPEPKRPCPELLSAHNDTKAEFNQHRKYACRRVPSSVRR